MKKIFFILAATAALLTSCLGGETIEELPNLTDRCPISVAPTNDNWDVKTRGFYLGTELYHSAQVYAYSDNGIVEAVAANNGMTMDLRIPVITLPLGEHKINAVTYSFLDNGLDIAGGDVIYPNNAQTLILRGNSRNPVYVGSQTINVASTKPASIMLDMQRATAMVKFSLAADGINYANFPLTVTLDQYTALDCRTLAISDKEEQTHRFAFKSKSEAGKPLRYESEYHFLCPEQGYVTDIAIEARDNKIVINDTIRNVPLERGKITTISGRLNKADGNINFYFGQEMIDGETINL